MKRPTAEQQREALGAFCDVSEPAAFKAPPWPEDCWEPGIYYDKSYEEYDALPAIRASSLHICNKHTLKHMLAHIEGRMEKDTPDRRWGRGLHCFLLEPERFKDEFLVSEPCSAALKGGNRKGEPCGKQGKCYVEVDGVRRWLCGTHSPADATEPRDFLSPEQFEQIQRTARAIKDHQVVRLLRAHGGTEVTLVWEMDGLPCKARCDKLIIDAECPTTILDCKKMLPMAGDDYSVQRAIRNHGYDIQAWWYSQGVKRLKDEEAYFTWIYAESGEPYDVRPLWADASLLELGRAKALSAVEKYKYAMQTGDWQGYSDGRMERIGPADWELKQWALA